MANQKRYTGKELQALRRDVYGLTQKAVTEQLRTMGVRVTQPTLSRLEASDSWAGDEFQVQFFAACDGLLKEREQVRRSLRIPSAKVRRMIQGTRVKR